MEPTNLPATQTDNKPPPTALQLFGRRVTKIADEACLSMLGEENGKIAAARVAMAFRTLSQRQPDVIDCTPESVGQCVALSAMTGLYPSPVNPGCYVIPRNRSFKKDNGDWGKVRELNWQISAVGLRSLSRAAGYDVRPVIVYNGDTLAHEGGGLDELSTEVPRLTRGPRPEPTADFLDMIQGVVVVAFNAETQTRIGWGWVGADAIAERRGASDAWQRGAKKDASDRDRSSPWFVWPAGMVEKTAVRYALTGARAIVPVADSAFTLALEADDRGERVEIEVQERRQIPATLDAAIGLEPAPEPAPAEGGGE